jgi:hypothetical protein
MASAVVFSAAEESQAIDFSILSQQPPVLTPLDGTVFSLADGQAGIVSTSTGVTYTARLTRTREEATAQGTKKYPIVYTSVALLKNPKTTKSISGYFVRDVGFDNSDALVKDFTLAVTFDVKTDKQSFDSGVYFTEFTGFSATIDTVTRDVQPVRVNWCVK